MSTTAGHQKILEVLASYRANGTSEMLGEELAKALGFVPDASIPDEAATDIYSRCRDNAGEWAAAFVRTAKRIGAGDFDEGWMIGWFANAIECAHFARKSAAEAALCGELQAGDVVALKSGGPNLLVGAIVGPSVQVYWVDPDGKMQLATLARSAVRRVLKAPEQSADEEWSNRYVGS